VKSVTRIGRTRTNIYDQLSALVFKKMGSCAGRIRCAYCGPVDRLLRDRTVSQVHRTWKSVYEAR
jgi:hypothetical protein